ncbi:dihydrolipoamide acetyltransferase family protein [Pontibacter silvestris]|uniref:Dihydrolipoamide acetyltransferase component of pyruvate dehydrogenase complex n=1 Tax=Pontibacter silvestris TaxID=2305183 RepID=A0ABW4WTG9_9BACT|nr:dihydrolipoamide acetyltransferase family protein [Pontibacter silvestris]MCC9136253.1 2-oxo acid dehydrogenase subunit E2 [Pontibacter silvestris]
MAFVEMVMPKMGESIMEGTILKWLKNVGDTIEEDESVLEVATDKVDTEVPAIEGGTLKEILAKEGDVVAVGAPIAIIATNGEDTTETPAATATEETTTAPAAEAEPASAEPNTVSAANPTVARLAQPAPGRFYSPLVLNIAREEGISMQELEYVPGTGQEGRVSKKDILAYVESRKGTPEQVQASTEASTTAAPVTNSQPQAAPATQTQTAPAIASKPTSSFSSNDEIIEMDRMRRLIADRMVESKRISPHVTSFVEADVTNLVNWRNKHKEAYKKREGENLTFTPLLIDAIIKAIKDFPMINVSVDGNNIIRHKDINVGMAVALPSGNLIVPNIKNADQMNLNGLTKKVNDLANRARNNKLTPDDLSGATYTVSNVGSFGNVMGTPIIMQPQVAIMALGAIKKKPAVIETPEGDLIGIRHFMFLSHSYDHRVVDGSLGGMFVRRVADYLEDFDPNTVI